MPDARAEVEIEYATEAHAARALGAVHADDDAFVRTQRRQRFLRAEFTAPDARSLLRAVDDFLACVAIAEDVMNAPPMGPANA